MSRRESRLNSEIIVEALGRAYSRQDLRFTNIIERALFGAIIVFVICSIVSLVIMNPLPAIISAYVMCALGVWRLYYRVFRSEVVDSQELLPLFERARNP